VRPLWAAATASIEALAELLPIAGVVGTIVDFPQALVGHLIASDRAFPPLPVG